MSSHSHFYIIQKLIYQMNLDSGTERFQLWQDFLKKMQAPFEGNYSSHTKGKKLSFFFRFRIILTIENMCRKNN